MPLPGEIGVDHRTPRPRPRPATTPTRDPHPRQSSPARRRHRSAAHSPPRIRVAGRGAQAAEAVRLSGRARSPAHVPGDHAAVHLHAARRPVRRRGRRARSRARSARAGSSRASHASRTSSTASSSWSSGATWSRAGVRWSRPASPSSSTAASATRSPSSAVRVQRDVDELLRVPEGAREVSRELLPAIERGLNELGGSLSVALLNEGEKTKELLAERVTTLFLQHAELAATVRDFYAYLGQVVTRNHLAPEEIAGFRNLLVEYIQRVVEDVLKYTPADRGGPGRLHAGPHRAAAAPRHRPRPQRRTRPRPHAGGLAGPDGLVRRPAGPPEPGHGAARGHRPRDRQPAGQREARDVRRRAAARTPRRTAEARELVRQVHPRGSARDLRGRVRPLLRPAPLPRAGTRLGQRAHGRGATARSATSRSACGPEATGARAAGRPGSSTTR